MSKLLRDSIAQLTSSFVTGVLAAVRGASIDDLASETGRPGGAKRGRPPGRAASASSSSSSGAKAPKGRRGRLPRRSPDDIANVVTQIVSLLGENSEGLRAEEIRAKLGLSAAELPRPITEALASRQVTKTGQKRATRYFAGSGKPRAKGGAKASSKKRGKRRGKRSAKKAAA